jgi:rhodanese-related sulfurtransferase
MRTLTPLATLLIAFSVVSCSAGPDSNPDAHTIAGDITAAQFAELTAKHPGIILDVRTPAEYEKGNIGNSANINFYDRDFVTQVERFEKSTPIYVYCQVGGRSAKAMKQLNASGFEEVYNLLGGYREWSKK